VNKDFRTYVAGLNTMVPTREGTRPYINFDNAASTPPFISVVEAVNNFAPWYSSVHRGNGLKSRLSTVLYEQARDMVGRFVGANPEEHVVLFGKNTTEAINKLSYRLPLRKSDIVLVSHAEHHSNDLPWRRRATVKRIGITADGSIDTGSYQRLLMRHKGQVRLVAITGASNVTGHLPDIHWFARLAHEAGAEILVDAAQLAAHRRIYMKRLADPEHLDYVAMSAHKMYAPYGTGALIGLKATFSRGEPEYRGGGTVQLVTTNTVDWASPPDSEEAGSPNVMGAVAMARATQTLQDIGMARIATHEAAITAYLLHRLREVPGLQIYGDSDPARAGQRSGVVPFSLQGMPAHLVAAILGYEWGIGVRSGCFCAHPYVMSLLGFDRGGIHRVRHAILHRQYRDVPGMVRASIGLYTSRADVDRLVEALQTMLERHGAYSFEKATGQYVPDGPPEDLARYFKL
jgi:cysteine desulfurase/selenocysteine lyase